MKTDEEKCEMCGWVGGPFDDWTTKNCSMLVCRECMEASPVEKTPGKKPPRWTTLLRHCLAAYWVLAAIATVVAFFTASALAPNVGDRAGFFVGAALVPVAFVLIFILLPDRVTRALDFIALGTPLTCLSGHDGEWRNCGPHPCQQELHCLRCGYVATRFKHEWRAHKAGSTDYGPPFNYVAWRECTRCGKNTEGVDREEPRRR